MKIKDDMDNAKVKSSRSEPRRPLRERGVQRFGVLVDATERLLQEKSIDDIGLYQIAEEANVPPASVYHFFPTKEAAFLALAERYLNEIAELSRQPIEAASLRGWQDLLAIDHRRAMLFFNDHEPAMKIFYGGLSGAETRTADIRFTSGIAKNYYRRYNHVFHMPFLRDPALRFRINISILDAIYAISYQENGTITGLFYEEALAACIAHGALFLSPRLEVRAEVIEAAELGNSIVLPSFQGD